MKTIIKLFFIITLVGFVSGCDLDRLPYNEITNEDIDVGNAENITLGTYAKLKEEYYYKATHYVNEYGGDNVSLSGTTVDNLYYLYKYQRLPNNNYMANLWKYSYQIIININGMINVIPEGESDDMDQVLGENYFLRAFMYFNLCNIFGRPYAQSPETNLGVPLKLSTNINEYPKRATVKEIYDQLVEDLEKAASLMESEKSNIYASKEVAYALLSRIYLYMQNWEKAAEYADLVIKSGRYTLLEGENYQKYPRFTPENNTETIWAIRMKKDTDFNKYHMDFYSVGSMYARINDTGWGEMYPSSSYLELLHRNPGDLRHGFIVPQELTPTVKWLIYTKGEGVEYTYVKNKVQLENGKYTITEKPGDYTNPQVQEETINGQTQYYVTRNDDARKYIVRIENACEQRNGYPVYYIYKCSLQEDQSHLWSPVILRLAEMYLNRAEANFHLGKTNEALADINIIRERAQIPERKLTDLPPGDGLLDWILEERRLELAWEGHRKLDIFRNGLTLDRRYPGGHLAGSPVYPTVAPTDNAIVELIPQRELDAYPIDLIQNP